MIRDIDPPHKPRPGQDPTDACDYELEECPGCRRLRNELNQANEALRISKQKKDVHITAAGPDAEASYELAYLRAATKVIREAVADEDSETLMKGVAILLEAAGDQEDDQ